MTAGDVIAVAAVTVDLDDTLFPQAEFLAGAWRAVADAAAQRGLDGATLHAELLAACAGGSDRGRIIDRALAAAGVSDAEARRLVPDLVDAFRRYAPDRLRPYAEVTEALAALRALVPVACVTDGDPAIQRAKLRALGLTGAFDAVVISDELGRDHRKPDPLPFARALALLGGVAPAVAVHVGDRPAKDVAGAAAAGMRCIRVRTGEYAHLPSAAMHAGGPIEPWRVAGAASSALRDLEALARSARSPGLAH